MNNFVNSEYDRFEKEKNVMLKEPISTSIIENTLELQDIRVAFRAFQKGENEPEIMFITLYAGNQPDIQEVLIKLNDEELFCYKQVMNSTSGLGCMITVADLAKICVAQTVEIRIKNSDGHTDFTSEDIQFGARVIYNAIVDENAYKAEIQRREEEEIEKQQELEREKLLEIEKFNQRIERIRYYGVNRFFSVDYDKFNQKLTVQIKEQLKLEQINGNLSVLEPKIGFRYVDSSKIPPFWLIDIIATSKNGLNLNKGELLLLLDETNRLSLQPHESFSESYLENYHIESDWYEITKEELKALCEARIIEMRITNGYGYADISTYGMQVTARRFYNAVIDSTAYTDDLLTQEEREAAERTRRQQEFFAELEAKRIEREAIEAKEARIRAEERAKWWAENKKKVGITILIIIGIIAAIISIKKIVNVIAAKHAVTQAYEMIEQGEALIPTYKFDEAKRLYNTAFSSTEDEEVRRNVQEKLKELEEASQTAENEYNDALRRLQILLDADDNKFNDLSNACLDKMIEIHPNAPTTQYYQNLRGR